MKWQKHKTTTKTKGKLTNLKEKKNIYQYTTFTLNKLCKSCAKVLNFIFWKFNTKNGFKIFIFYKIHPSVAHLKSFHVLALSHSFFLIMVTSCCLRNAFSIRLTCFCNRETIGTYSDDCGVLSQQKPALKGKDLGRSTGLHHAYMHGYRLP